MRTTDMRMMSMYVYVRFFSPSKFHSSTDAHDSSWLNIIDVKPWFQPLAQWLNTFFSLSPRGFFTELDSMDWLSIGIHWLHRYDIYMSFTVYDMYSVTNSAINGRNSGHWKLVHDSGRFLAGTTHADGLRGLRCGSGAGCAGCAQWLCHYFRQCL